MVTVVANYRGVKLFAMMMQDYGCLLLVKGGVKPASKQLDLMEGGWFDSSIYHHFSEINSRNQFEEMLTNMGVFFDLDEVGSREGVFSYRVSRDEAVLSELIACEEAMDAALRAAEDGARTEEEREEIFLNYNIAMASLLGYPEDAAIAYSESPWYDRETRLPDGLGGQYQCAILTLKGGEVPPWFHYIWHIPAQENLLKGISQSSIEIAEGYRRYFEEHEPEFNTWLLYERQQELYSACETVGFILNAWEE